MNNYQHRDKLFFANPVLFPNWPYKSRYAIGLKLSDFWARNEKTYRFKVNGIMYEIDKDKAQELGMRYRLTYGKLPNIVPLAEFHIVEEEKPKVEILTLRQIKLL